jgi:hypothetical protein
VAVLTGKAAFYIHFTDIKTDHMMAAIFSRFTKRRNHFCGIAVWSGASVQYKNFHDIFSLPNPDLQACKTNISQIGYSLRIAARKPRQSP